MSERYNITFIKEIVLRIDFNDTPLNPKNGLPGDLKKKALMEFPISEPKPFILRNVNLDKDKKDVQDSMGVDWIYHGKNRDKSLTISYNNMNIIYKRYEPIESIKKTFSSLVDELFEGNPDLLVNRMGLRYINHIDIPNSSNPFDWSNLLNKNLIYSLNFLSDKSSILRSLNLFDIDYSDMRILFQYGMTNPDHPAPIKKKFFILDYDASLHGLQTKEDIKENISKFYFKIDELFEASIDSGLRDIMNA